MEGDSRQVIETKANDAMRVLLTSYKNVKISAGYEGKNLQRDPIIKAENNIKDQRDSSRLPSMNRETSSSRVQEETQQHSKTPSVLYPSIHELPPDI